LRRTMVSAPADHEGDAVTFESNVKELKKKQKKKKKWG